MSVDGISRTTMMTSLRWPVVVELEPNALTPAAVLAHERSLEFEPTSRMSIGRPDFSGVSAGTGNFGMLSRRTLTST